MSLLDFIIYIYYMSVSTALNRWFDRFFEEKGIDPDDTFELEENYFNYGVIMEQIQWCSDREKEKIQSMLVKIDFQNGDVAGYLRHLANALVVRL